jgi:stringent starvation protein B
LSDAPDIATTSTRPYLLRALHEWMLDNQLTPQLVVDAQSPDVQVPRQFVQDGRIVLNVSTSAVRHLILGNEFVEFSARFSGSPFQVSVPVAHVSAIVARENGAGMSFPPEPERGTAERSQGEESGDTDSPPDDPPPTRPSSAKRGHLKIVK